MMGKETYGLRLVIYLIHQLLDGWLNNTVLIKVINNELDNWSDRELDG